MHERTREPAQPIACAGEEAALVQTRTRLAQAAFLTEFRHTCNIRLACELSGVGRRTVYDWRERDAQFQQQYLDAEQDAVDRLEASVWVRAVDGFEQPVFQKGALVGHTREYSDHLAIALLKAHRPEKFKEEGYSGPAVIVQVGIRDSDVQISVQPPAQVLTEGLPPSGDEPA